jgi:hypothetical protein
MGPSLTLLLVLFSALWRALEQLLHPLHGHRKGGRRPCRELLQDTAQARPRALQAEIRRFWGLTHTTRNARK